MSEQEKRNGLAFADLAFAATNRLQYELSFAAPELHMEKIGRVMLRLADQVAERVRTQTPIVRLVLVLGSSADAIPASIDPGSSGSWPGALLPAEGKWVFVPQRLHDRDVPVDVMDAARAWNKDAHRVVVP